MAAFNLLAASVKKTGGSEAASFCSSVEAGWWLDLETRFVVRLRCTYLDVVDRKFVFLSRFFKDVRELLKTRQMIMPPSI